jgi:hypothetical protein
MHLLPGLAMYAHRHFPDPPAIVASFGRNLPPLLPWNSSEGGNSGFKSNFAAGSLFWLFVMPMAFYLAWQFLYFLVVQVSKACIMDSKPVSVDLWLPQYCCTVFPHPQHPQPRDLWAALREFNRLHVDPSYCSMVMIRATQLWRGVQRRRTIFGIVLFVAAVLDGEFFCMVCDERLLQDLKNDHAIVQSMFVVCSWGHYQWELIHCCVYLMYYLTCLGRPLLCLSDWSLQLLVEPVLYLSGLIQATYTAGVLIVFFPTYHFFFLATFWQVCTINRAFQRLKFGFLFVMLPMWFCLPNLWSELFVLLCRQ